MNKIGRALWMAGCVTAACAAEGWAAEPVARTTKDVSSGHGFLMAIGVGVLVLLASVFRRRRRS